MFIQVKYIYLGLFSLLVKYYFLILFGDFKIPPFRLAVELINLTTLFRCSKPEYNQVEWNIATTLRK